MWCERWGEPAERLSRIERELRSAGAATRKGGDFERWDLEVRGGTFGVARLLMAVEEHGQGTQLVRVRWWLRPAPAGIILAAGLAGIAAVALRTEQWIPAGVFGGGALWCAWHALADCARAAGDIRRVVARAGDD